MRDPLALLPGLLAYYSPTGEEEQAVSFLAESMGAMGFEVWCDEAGNVIGSRGSGNREILLLGHIDTVSGMIPVRWEGDVIYGRGAVDAKGPLACFVSAGAAARLTPDWRITVIGAVGEEGDSRGAKHVCQTHPAPKMVVIGEPSGWDHLTLGYKGSYWFRYRLSQPMVHTAANGASACETAVDFWNRLSRVVAQWNEGKERLFDQLTPTLRSIQMFPDDYSEIVEMRVGMRLPPKLDQPALEALLDGVMETGERFVEDYLPAYRAEKNTPLVRAFLSAIRKAGGQPAFSLKTGTSDMNLVGPFWNCPIVAYGPGDSSLDHTPYEHLRISEYLTSVSVLTQALEIIMNTNV